MRSTLEELWHGNISPETDSRSNTPEMKRLMEYMARHHDTLMTTMTDEQKDIFERFDDCWRSMRVLLKSQFSCMHSGLERILQ